VRLQSGNEQFTVDDLIDISELVAETWLAAADRDWSRQAGTLEWSCLATADHAVDCVYGAAFLLASRRDDTYPEAGDDLTLGDKATPELIVESLRIATRIVVAVVRDAPSDVESIIFQRPEPTVAPPRDFPPRAAAELALHAHDVTVGLGVPFEPPVDVSRRLREHTRPWPLWSVAWQPLGASDDPWGDMLDASARARPHAR
jgi:hypothetical protein